MVHRRSISTRLGAALLFIGTLLRFPSPANAIAYTLCNNIVNDGLWKSFSAQSIDDPTAGRVDYQTKDQLIALGLVSTSAKSMILRAESKTNVGSGRGRKSFRIKSNTAYTNHVVIFNILHMPEGCGTWPAVWEVADNGWPAGGELDIVEGVNDQGTNQATIHTGDGCMMPGLTSRDMGITPDILARSGVIYELLEERDENCYALIKNNAGCGIRFPTANSFGPAFNANGGGWYAAERTSTDLRVWFWARDDKSVPQDVMAPTALTAINTQSWGPATAHFPGTQCNIAKYFKPHNIIINLTFCGTWAGNAYPKSCPSTCEDFVNNNPGAFDNAFFEFASIRVYLPSAKAKL